jgi:hypothetical protein
MITGSTAGIIYGEPRMTHDVDIVVALAPAQISSFAAAYPMERFYCPPEDVIAIEVRRAHRGHFNLIHHDTGFKADIYLAFDELHRWGLAHRRVVDVGTLRVQVAPVEYVVLRKLEYYREGGSEKHLRDIRAMLDVSADDIDRTYLDEQIALRGLDAAWRAVVADHRG